MRRLTLPFSEDDVHSLHAGDLVSLSGACVTARDAAHQFMLNTLINGTVPAEDAEWVHQLRMALQGGAIYHCGPVMKHMPEGWRVIAAGPTTSIREEEYEDMVIQHFGVRAIIGKGGMGHRTRLACQQHGAVYLHAVGGAAAMIAQSISEVLGVWKLEFGIPEALWHLRITDMKLLVTMDTHGRSLHEEVEKVSTQRLQELLGRS